jgi:hypothetical protein
MLMKSEAVIVTAAVLAHHAVACVHGGAHTDLAIEMALWQTTFINVVILLLPLAGAVLMWTSYRRLGLYAVAAGMTGALVFGVVHHYMMESADHIAHLPTAEAHVHATFEWTAGAIAMLEGAGAAIAAYFLGRGSGSPQSPVRG